MKKVVIIFGFLAGLGLMVNGLSYAGCTDKSVSKNGWCQPQCVDYVNCRLGTNHHVGSAAKWWSNPPSGYKKNANGSKSKPGKNDIIVWTNLGDYGHVAVVDSVDTKNDTIHISDTNYSKNTKTDCQLRNRSLKYKKKDGRYYIDGIAGWLEKK